MEALEINFSIKATINISKKEKSQYNLYIYKNKMSASGGSERFSY
jgi:hypothetical protein